MNYLIKQYQRLGSEGFLFVATLLVNIGNYGLNLVLARVLGPAGFAEANLIATLVMVLSFIAMGIQLTVAKLSAEANALDNKDASLAMIKSISKSLFRFSIGLVILLVLVSSLIASYLNFYSEWSLVILFVGIPFYLLMSLRRGQLQGEQQFFKLAMSYLIEMTVRVLLTVLLIWSIGQQGFDTELISLGFLASFFACWIYTKGNDIKDRQQIENPNVKPLMQFLLVVATYELAQILINNSDVILVKHFFEAETAGLYASLALLGRAVFFATWTIVTILFPKVIEKEKKGEAHGYLFRNAIALVSLFGALVVGVCYFLGGFIINMAFGASYLGVAHYLWIYALSTTLFAVANVYVYYYMSLGKYTPIFLTVCFGFMQIVAISIYHNSLFEVVTAQIILMSLLLISMMIYRYLESSNATNLILEKS